MRVILFYDEEEAGDPLVMSMSIRDLTSHHSFPRFVDETCSAVDSLRLTQAVVSCEI